MIVKYMVTVILPDQEDEQLGREEADIVMANRLCYDEWHGFDYQIQYQRHADV